MESIKMRKERTKGEHKSKGQIVENNRINPSRFNLVNQSVVDNSKVQQFNPMSKK